MIKIQRQDFNVEEEIINIKKLYFETFSFPTTLPLLGRKSDASEKVEKKSDAAVRSYL